METFTVINLLFISILSAFAGFGFNIMQTSGMAFESYKDFLEELPRIKDKDFPYNSEHTYYKESKFLYYLAKPLGLCIVCNTTWIGMIITILYLKELSLLHLLLTVFTGVASAGIVTLINNYYNKLRR